jgi:hypothetical protein
MFGNAVKKTSAFDATCTITYPDKEVNLMDDDIISMPMKCISEQEQMLKLRKKQYKPAERLRLQIHRSDFIKSKQKQKQKQKQNTRSTDEYLSNSMDSILTLFE